MAFADLQESTTEIGDEIAQLDLRAITGLLGSVGGGLFSAEFFAEIMGNAFGDGSAARRHLIELLTKAGVGGAALLVRSWFAGPLLGIALLLGAVGAGTSVLLQLMEIVVTYAQEGEIQASAPDNEYHVDDAAGGRVEDSGFSDGTTQVSA